MPSPVRALALAGLVAIAGIALPNSAFAVVTATGANGSAPSPSLSLDGVGLLSNGCTSVLLQGGAWMLASAHCAGNVGQSVTFGNGSVAVIAATVVNPGYAGEIGVDDLSLMRLAAPVSVAGYALQAAAVDGRTVLVAGYGAGGSGSTGASQAGGVLRYGYNQYENTLVGTAPDDPDYRGRVAGYDFDDGSAALNRFGTLGLGSNEASVANNDSGGPSFSFANGAWGVAGIHVGVEDTLGFGYGGIGYDLMLGEYLPWIAQVSGVPEPSAAWLMLAGVAGVFGAMRKRRAA